MVDSMDLLIIFGTMAVCLFVCFGVEAARTRARRVRSTIFEYERGWSCTIQFETFRIRRRWYKRLLLKGQQRTYYN